VPAIVFERVRLRQERNRPLIDAWSAELPKAA